MKKPFYNRLDRIKEVVIPSNYDSNKIIEIFGEDYFAKVSDQFRDSLSRFYAVYIAEKKPYLLFGHACVGKQPIKNVQYKSRFRSYLSIHKPKTIIEFLFYSDYYHQCVQSGKRPFIDFNFKPIPEIDDILTESHGLLLWTKQLKKIIMLFDIDEQKASKLIKEINAKRAEVIDELKQMDFQSGTNLMNVLNERMLLGVVNKHNLEGALALYNYLILEV